ncbi:MULTISPECIES: LysE family translocator [Enterobacterales]|uniref:LysE family translocator n=1 Tax=Enterobacterales TaxID=91347 RepID=UPI00084815F2|nr:MULTISPECIES: LysE family translocator [Enterobacterales]ODQ05331.1 lysine transporter LysE [Shigella sp. FC130]OEI92782.1 lysine transporter LysE [Shigella sp. FC1655]WOO48204.1 LysE family translocator [Hafnia alvei]WPF02667.1 LysE family translocator [Proteus vulgaris]
MSELIAVAMITILAVISPGPDFAMVTKNSYSYGVKVGLITAMGIAIGVQVHVFYTVFGISFIIMGSPMLFFIMKLLGVGYLIYLGFKSLTNNAQLTIENALNSAPSVFQALRVGFFTNALNPKTMLFVIALYTQVANLSNPLWLNLSYGMFISMVHWIWFSCVALFFSTPLLRAKILSHQKIADKIIGVLLILLGVGLLFISVN